MEKVSAPGPVPVPAGGTACVTADQVGAAAAGAVERTGPHAAWPIGMAISFIGGILVMPVAGISINMISMFAFLVVLGIVVDDAIVVGENVYEYREEGLDHMSAAIKGAREVAMPVTFAILTTIVAFVPLLFMPGTTGKFWWPLPAVVITVLAMSLLEALFILPAHLAHSSSRPRTAGRASGDGREGPPRRSPMDAGKTVWPLIVQVK